MEKSQISSLNGITVWKDEAGVTHFVSSDTSDEKHNVPVRNDGRSWFQRLCDWLTGSSGIKPYVKIRNLADPFGDRSDPDAGSDGKSAVEGGIKISF